MKLVIGLGNIGEKYENTRHNVGFKLAEKLAEKYNATWEEQKKFRAKIAKSSEGIVFAEPQTFMNSSGIAVAKLKNYYNVQNSNLWVIHDDLDIKLGQYKIQFGKGPKVHNGLTSVYEKLGTSDFWHVRIGVDNRDSENRTPGEIYVLQNFSVEEALVLNTVVKDISLELFSKLNSPR